MRLFTVLILFGAVSSGAFDSNAPSPLSPNYETPEPFGQGIYSATPGAPQTPKKVVDYAKSQKTPKNKNSKFAGPKTKGKPAKVVKMEKPKKASKKAALSKSKKVDKKLAKKSKGKADRKVSGKKVSPKKNLSKKRKKK